MSRLSRLRQVVVISTASLAVTLVVPTATAAPPPSAPLPAPPAAGRYVVALAQAPLASYSGGVRGLAATRPAAGRKVDATSSAARDYQGYLTGLQDRVASRVGVQPTRRYSMSLNGFVADLTPAQARALQRIPGVVSVTKDLPRRATDDRNSVDFLRLSGRTGVWSAIGGVSKAGRGVVVGVVDTGFWPESASFAGRALGTAKPTAADPFRPYRSGGTITMAKSDGGRFTGICQAGESFDASDCNTKVVGARFFDEGYLASVPPEDRAEDFASPRDGNGHGSHTGSTAAGNTGVSARIEGRALGKISGVAPAAKLSVYKALWETPDGGASGYTSDLVAAIDAAVGDGVDVINYSVGGGSESPADDPVALAFLSAASAGIFVSTSAGNAGPGASTLDNTSPWVTTVAASTIAPQDGTVVLGDGRRYAGVSATVSRTVGPARIITAVAGKAAAADLDEAALCTPDTLERSLVAGTIVVCDRGVVDRVAKSAEVKRAGGIGMVLANLTEDSLDPDLHRVPSVHLGPLGAKAVKAYAGTAGATASLRAGNLTSTKAPYPQIAGFSSRGPAQNSNGDLLKPDIAAPGVGILAAVAPPSNDGQSFAFLSGTSMAAPHIAGLAALFFGQGVHPGWSPMRVKSALMTTAGNTKDRDGKPATDPFAQGAGQVRPSRMFNPGLVYRAFDQDWLSYLKSVGVDLGTKVPAVDTSDYNAPSIAIGTLLGHQTVTRRVTAARAGSYRASVSVPGINARVTPSVLRFTKVGQSKTFKVRFTRTSAAYDKAATGFLTWRSSAAAVRSPIAVTPRRVSAPAALSVAGASGSASYWIVPATAGAFPLKASGLTAGRATSATIAAGDLNLYPITVARGAQALQLSIRTAADEADLDLYLFRAGDETGDPVALSAGPTADETIRLRAPEPGKYIVQVAGFANAPGTTSTAYTFRAGTVTSSSTGAGFRVTPTNPRAVVGQPVRVTASWAGADPDIPYLGFVEYPGGDGTLVTLN